MLREFDEFYEKSCLPMATQEVKTLTKKELGLVYEYMKRKKPEKILDIGTQTGCSAIAFSEISNALDLEAEVHSWDVLDCRYSAFVFLYNFHQEDLTGIVSKTLEKYAPDFVYLDAHPFWLTFNFIDRCLYQKIDFLLHDISLDHFDLLKDRWELPLLGALVSPKIWTQDVYEDDRVKVTCCRDRFGVAIVEVK